MNPPPASDDAEHGEAAGAGGPQGRGSGWGGGERHDPYAALRVRDYRLFLSGWVVSSAGLQALSTAIGWEVYERTGDAFALGLIGLARALPVLALALIAGQLVDLLDRRKMLMATQAGFAASTGLLALASWAGAPLAVIYGLIVLTGCARVFNQPTRSALLPRIVPVAAFPNAVTWNSGGFQLSALGGPMIAGGLIWATGSAWPVYALTAVACAAFAFEVSFIRLRPLTAAEVAERAAAGHGHGAKFSFDGMLEGLRHLWREKVILGAITLDMLAVLLGGATALLPVYAKDILQTGPLGLGVLRASPYAGALLMALVLAHRPPFERAGRALLWSVAGFGAATIVFGLSTSMLLSVAMLLTLGALDNISVVVRHVLVQARTPDHLRGRVSAVNSVFIESSNELGGFESGLVAKFFGPVVSVVSGGIGTIAVVAAIAAAFPGLRRLGRLHERGPG